MDALNALIDVLRVPRIAWLHTRRACGPFRPPTAMASSRTPDRRRLPPLMPRARRMMAQQYRQRPTDVQV